MKYLFGPLPSRRYGQSLGVDLIPMKTCSLSCIFCQLGPTPSPTLERVMEPPIGEIIAELREFLASNPAPDYVTAAGSGEPTLHRDFGELLRYVNEHTACKSLLLSNGTLFTKPDVRRAAAEADVVKVSLHAWDQASFERICRPAAGLDFKKILRGYQQFRQIYRGRLDLEVFIIPGINDTPEAAGRIAALARTFAPDVISLNTAVRPPTDPSVKPCPKETLDALRPLFGPQATEAGDEIPLPKDLPPEEAAAILKRHPLINKV